MHGGIDGYSRLPVYLHASNNNKAATVLSLFQKAVSSYGLPSRVRCDKGGENYDVGWYMLNHSARGPGRGSIIAGRFTLWWYSLHLYTTPFWGIENCVWKESCWLFKCILHGNCCIRCFVFCLIHASQPILTQNILFTYIYYMPLHQQTHEL